MHILGSEKKVMIGISCGDTMHTDFVQCLMKLVMRRHPGCFLAVAEQRSSSCVIGRNLLIQRALDNKMDYILFLDTDMVFPADTLLRLMEHKKLFVCADARRRHAPYTTVCEEKETKFPIDWKKDQPPLVQLSGGSLAVALLDVHAISDVPAPWFLFKYEDKTLITEDYYFTRKLQKDKSISSWCDTKLSREVYHIGQFKFGIDSFLVKQEERGES